MATVQFPVAFQNTVANAFDDLVNAGAGAGELEFTTSADTTFATPLLTLTLSDPAHGAAAAGVVTISGTPISGSFSGNGTIALGRYVDSNGNECARGNATLPGGGGMFILDNLTAATGLPVSLVSGSIAFLTATI
jgi:hypothetical protein